MDTEKKRPHIHSLTREALVEVCVDLGIPRFRSDQLFEWLHAKCATNWDEMTNIPKALREKLAATYEIAPLSFVRSAGNDEGTRKLLLQLSDGDLVECVIIMAQGRRTVCVSTQVGCKFGCVFCASGQAGFMRDLTAGEIVGQLLHATRELGERPTNVVFMGIGEPMDNYESVLDAIRIMNDERGLHIGARKITISTVGVVPGIERLATEGLQVELSVSLHNADDDARDRIMPVNRRYPVDHLMEACADYVEKTGRIITFEYTMIAGENDSEADARRLAAVLSTFPCRVNLIRLNPIDEYEARPSSRRSIDRFVGVLRRAGVNVTVRDSRGRSVGGACGQLRVRELAGADAPAKSRGV